MPTVPPADTARPSRARRAARHPATDAAATDTRALFRRVLRNAGLVLTGKAAAGVLNLAATALAVRALGAEAFGALLLVHGLARTAGSVAKFQSWQSVLRFGAPALREGRREDLRALLRFTAGLDAASGVAGAAGCALAAVLLAPVFGWSDEARAAAPFYASAVAFMTLATPIGVLRLFDRFKAAAARDAVGALVRLLCVLAAAAAGGGVGAFLAAWYAGVAAEGAAGAHAAWRELRRRDLLGGPRPPRAAAVHPGLWDFAWSTNLNTVLSLGHGQLGTLLVGALLGPASAALYGVARQVGEAALKPTRFLVPAIYPEMAHLAAAGDRAGARALLVRSLRASSAGAAAGMAALVLLGAPLLRLVGGEAVATADGVYAAALLTGAGALAGLAGVGLEPLLISVGAHRAALRARAAGLASYVPGALALTALAGLPGAGAASLLAALATLACQAAAVLRWVRRPPADAARPRQDVAPM